MRIVDFHTHVFADDLAPRAIPALEEQGGIRARYDGTVGGLVAAMDRSGVDVSVIQPVATKPSQVATINDWAATQASSRIVPFGTMHPELDDPAAEIARMASLGLRGFKMHPEYQLFEPHEPRMGVIYEAAARHGLIVLFHAGEDLMFDTVRGTCESFRAVLDAYPRLTVVLAHMGGFHQWTEAAELLAGRDVWLDTAYTLGHLPDEEFATLVEAHGAHRVLFGSDGPWTDAGSEIAHMQRMRLPAESIEAILGGNAERLLGLWEVR